MASLLSATEIASITGAFGDVFDTFAKQVVVWKEPIKVVSDLNLDFLLEAHENSIKADSGKGYESARWKQ